MLRSRRGPVVIEVNSSPGLEGIERATGADIAGEIIRFLEINARHGATETKGKG
jgi:ribosomal protein S6--L-glutamate ligase